MYSVFSQIINANLIIFKIKLSEFYYFCNSKKVKTDFGLWDLRLYWVHSLMNCSPFWKDRHVLAMFVLFRHGTRAVANRYTLTLVDIKTLISLGLLNHSSGPVALILSCFAEKIIVKRRLKPQIPSL